MIFEHVNSIPPDSSNEDQMLKVSDVAFKLSPLRELNETNFMFSVWAKATASTNITIAGGTESVTEEIGTSWKRITVQLLKNASETSADVIIVVPEVANNGYIYFYKAKLESGTRSTDWTPAPEDIEGRVGTTESQIIQLSDSITSIVSSVSEVQDTAESAVANIVVQYYLSDYTDSLHGGSWADTAPSWVNGKYMWSRTKITNGKGDIDYKPSENGTCIAGAKGETGSGGTPGRNTAMVYLYKRDTGTPSIGWRNDLTYNFANKSLSSVPSGWSATIPTDSSNPIYVTAAIASSAADTDDIPYSEWATPALLAQNGTNGTNGVDGQDGRDGTDGNDGLNCATVMLYKRAATIPTSTAAKPSGTITYTFATGAVSGSLNEWTKAIPDGTNPCWVIQATAASTGTTDTILISEWTTPTKLVEDGAKGESGTDGKNTAIVYLYKRSTSAPSIDWSTNLTYDFDQKQLTSVPSGWYKTIPSGTDPLYVTAATASASGSTDTIASSEWATPALLAQNGTNGTNGVDGQDGINGLNTAIVFLYKRAQTEPAKPTGSFVYTFSTGALTGSLNNWTQSIPANDGNPCWIIQAAAISNSATYTITNWSKQEKLVENGEDGADGVSIGSIINYYLATSASSGVTTSTTGWTTGIQSMDSEKKYLWNYEEVKSVTNVILSTTAPCIIGHYANDGKGISSITEYYARTSTTATPADSSFDTTIPTLTTTLKYLWNYEKIIYTDNTNYTSGKRIIGVYGDQGATGATGQGISAIKTQYYLSTSSTSQSGGSWQDVEPTWELNKYIWTRSEITWNNPTSTTHTTPILATTYNNMYQKITYYDTQIEQLDDKINLRATKTEVEGLATRVEAAELELAPASITSKVTQSDEWETLSTTVTQTASGLTVVSTKTDNLEDAVSDAQTTATAAQQIANAKTTQFYQANEPESALGGDVWTKTGSDRVLRKDGTGTNTSSTQEAYSIPVGENVHSIQPIIIGGKTVVMNQHVQNGNFADASGWGAALGTIAVADNEATYTVTGISSTAYSANIWRNIINIIAGHKYMVCYQVKLPKAVNCGVAILGAGAGGGNITFTNSAVGVADKYIQVNQIFTAVTAKDLTQIWILFDGRTCEIGDVVKFKNVMLVDLTQMFGSAVTATIATPEQAYALGVPREYVPYNPGELVSADVNAINAIGFNLLNPDEFEPNTRIYVSSGSALSYSGLTASGWIEALPDTAYYLNMPSIGSSYAGTAFYDADKRYISGVAHTRSSSYTVGILTTPPNCAYIRTCWTNSDTDLCVNVSDADFNGQFTEFTPVQSFPIPAEVRAQYPLRSVGTVHDSYEYDAIDGTWSYVQRVGSIDLGTPQWTTTGVSIVRFITADGTAVNSDWSDGNNTLCSRYAPHYNSGGYTDPADKFVFIDSNGRIVVSDSEYSDGATLKAALNSVMLYFELAAPVTVDITDLMPVCNIVNAQQGGQIVFAQAETALAVPSTLLLSPWRDITEEANALALAAQDDAAVAQSSADEARRIAELAAAGVDETQQVIRIETDGLYLYPGKRTESGIEINTDGYHQRFTNRSQRVQRSGTVHPDFATSNRVIVLGTQAIVRTVDGGTGFRLATVDDYAALGE